MTWVKLAFNPINDVIPYCDDLATNSLYLVILVAQEDRLAKPRMF